MSETQWPDEVEWGFRERRYEQLRAQLGDEVAETNDRVAAERAAARPELDEIIEAYRSSRDAEAFRGAIDSWSRGKPYFGFAGPNGAMFVNQLVKDSAPDRARHFIDLALTVPADDVAAQSAMDELSAHVVELREQGSSAAVGRVASFFTWFWWLYEPETWTHNWNSARKALKAMGCIVDEGTQWEQYQSFREHIRRFGPAYEVGRVLQLAHRSGRYGLDITTSDRLLRVAEAPRAEDGPQFENSKQTIETIRWMMRTLRDIVTPIAEELFQKPFRGWISPDWWTDGRLREDFHASWMPKVDHRSPQIMLIVSQEDVRIGMYASAHQTGGAGFSQLAVQTLHGNESDGLEWLAWGYGVDDDFDPLARPGNALLGRRFALSDLATHEALVDAVSGVISDLLPVFALVDKTELNRASSSTEEPSASAQPEPVDKDEQLQLFLRETHYPDEDDSRAKAQQRQWQALLQPDRLASLPMSELRRIYSGAIYGNPGPQSILHATLAGNPAETVDRFLSAINHLLWADDEDLATRIDRVMDEEDLGLRGFKESTIMKLLAVARPDEFLAVYPFTGDRGKSRAMTVLGLTPPPMTATVGERSQASTTALKEALEPMLPGDSWGQSRFLYWLMDREQQWLEGTPDAGPQALDRIGTTADDLSLPRPFLHDLAALLEQERQLIFYGPPGTGKTFVAQRLAEAIAPNPDNRMLVQFHPSTSYEDFFEGYRPVSGGDDQIAYRLMPGPLRIMAERAAADPAGNPHLLIVDEINRANIAKVLGELLFLLEYRDEEVRPLYRPDEPFSLPKNLWLIGTMNTADRSIATVDAALRRRFHFIPFVPDDRSDNPISDLLGRWLEDNKQDPWLADLVDGVNQKLRGEIGGDHLLLGPSYFMKEDIGRAELAQIWRYRIEPLIDDIFFGDERAKAFRFDAVWREFGPTEDSQESEQ